MLLFNKFFFDAQMAVFGVILASCIFSERRASGFRQAF